MDTTRTRIHGIDLLRGLVIVLMALDHVRDFYSPTPFRPEDLSLASPELFLTRWITHFCAPTFVLLAGVSAWLHRETRGIARGDFARFLVSRGLWLIVLELAIVNPSWDLDLFGFTFLQVIWAIGVGMIVLAALIQGPRWLPLAFGLVVVLGHNLLDPVVPADLGSAASLWTLLHDPGPTFGGLYSAYPLLPWLGVIALGYGLAPWLVGERRIERRIVLAGSLMILAFVVLRLGNHYGNPTDWVADERGALWSTLGALNVQKYPPSLHFLLMTLGPALILLVAFEHLRGRWSRPLEVFGRVPLFFYLIHVPVIALTATVWSMLTHGARIDLYAGEAGLPPGYSPDLTRVYVAWLLIVVLLYPICAWYDRYKRAHPEQRWLRYL
jgi:uncharacterized membrane protein